MFKQIEEFQSLLKDPGLRTEESKPLEGRLTAIDITDKINDELVGRIETMQYPSDFNFEEADFIVRKGFDKALKATDTEEKARLYREVMLELFKRFDAQIKKAKEDLNLDLKVEIGITGNDFFNRYEGYKLNDVPFSMQLGFALYMDEYMKNRQKELYESKNFPKDLVEDLAFTFGSLYENAATWGNRGNVSKPINVGNRFVKPYLLGVQDHGKGFDFEAQRKKKLTSRIADYGGTGLHLARTQKGFNLIQKDKGRSAIVDYTPRIKG